MQYAETLFFYDCEYNIKTVLRWVSVLYQYNGFIYLFNEKKNYASLCDII